MASPSFRFTNRNAPRLPAGPLPAQTDAPPQATSPKPGEPGSGSSFDLPPDQQGLEGHYNPTNGLTGYATPNGWFMVDAQGNWFDQMGAPMQFNQTGGVDRSVGDARRAGGGVAPTQDTTLTGGGTIANTGEYTINGRQYKMTPQGLMDVATGKIEAPADAPVQTGSGAGGGVAPTQNTTLTGGGTIANTGEYTINGRHYKMTPQGLMDVATGKIDAPADAPVQTGSGAGGGTTTTTTPPPPKPPAFNYLSGVTSANPLGGTNAVNSTQFATPDAAQGLAKQLGGTAYGLQLQGPGYGFSQPMQQIRFGNGQEINAGLAGDLYSKYGSAPGTYGNYLVNRDVTGDYGPSAWDTKQNASGAAEMQQVEAKRQQDAQFGQQVTDQYQQQFAGQRQSEVQQATQALQANGWAQTPDGAWTNTRTGETQYADPVVLLMREMPGLQSISGSWEPPSMAAMQQQAPQQQSAPQPQQQPYYPPQPMPPQSTAQQGAERYQQTTQPQQYYPQPQGQQMQTQQQPQQQGYYPQQGQYYGQQSGQQSYGQKPMRTGPSRSYGQSQMQQPNYYQQQPQQYSQGQQYYPQQNSYGSGSQTQQQQPSQQGYYTAGQSSGQYKSPYGGGYLGYGNPTQSKSGGYMQTGKTTF